MPFSQSCRVSIQIRGFAVVPEGCQYFRCWLGGLVGAVPAGGWAGWAFSTSNFGTHGDLARALPLLPPQNLSEYGRERFPSSKMSGPTRSPTASSVQRYFTCARKRNSRNRRKEIKKVLYGSREIGRDIPP